MQGAIDQAKREDTDSRERAKREREAAEIHARELAERRSKADARVDYSVHEQGVSANIDPNAITDGQRKKLAFMGLAFGNVAITKRQAMRMIGQLIDGIPPAEVARTNRLPEGEWNIQAPSSKQQWLLRSMGVNWCKTPREASLAIGASKSPQEFLSTMTAAISGAKDHAQLDSAKIDLRNVLGSIGIAKEAKEFLFDLGIRRRAALGPRDEAF